MEMAKVLKQIVLTAILLTGTALVLAEEDVCSPFKDGVVDDSLLATMLSAANDGHLYRIQQTSSQVRFCVNSKMSRIEGNFSDFTGGMSLNPVGKGNGQTVVLVKAGSLNTKGAFIKSILKSEKFFDVENHPEFLFVSTGFDWTGPDTALLKGDLTMKGITKPVIFNVTLKTLDARQDGHGQKIVVNATTTIDRADFGMESLSMVVGSNVRLCLSIEALKYQA